MSLQDGLSSKSKLDPEKQNPPECMKNQRTKPNDPMITRSVKGHSSKGK